MTKLKFGALSVALAVCALAVFMVPDAHAAAVHLAHAAPVSDGVAYLANLVLAVGLDGMRAQHADLTSKATAKLAEVKDGLPADKVRAIEADHAAILRDVALVSGAIMVAERNAAPAAENVKPWAAGFFASAGALDIPLVKLNEIVASSATHDAAKDALIALMAAGNANKPSPNGARAEITADGRDRFIAGVEGSLLAKANMGFTKEKHGAERNEFSSLSLREIARMSLERSGVKLTGTGDAMMMVGRAFSPVIMAGAHSTSDFVNILANVANKSMLKGWEEIEETFQKWTGKGTLPDFKIGTRVDLGVFDNFDNVLEQGEYRYASMTDRKVQFVLATYGKLFAIDRPAIINDDLGAFTRIPAKMGRAAKRTIGNLVYAVLTANAALPDGVALFHATHKNLQTGAGSVLQASSLDLARAAMAKQQDPDAKATALNIRPKYLLVPVALQGTAHQTMASQSEPGQNNPAVANRVANMAEVISDARLDVNSSVAWYLAADPSTTDTIEVDYLNGVDMPVLEQREGWTQDGVEFKVRIDAGVTPVDFRGLYKSAGA